MTVTTTGRVELEPFAGGGQPTPLATFIGAATSLGDGSAGLNTVNFTLSQDLAYVARTMWAGQDGAATMEAEYTVVGLPHTQIMADTIALLAGFNGTGRFFDVPKWLIRPAGTDLTITFHTANVDTLTFQCGFRWYGFPKTVLRDFTAAELLGYVLR